MPMRSHSRGERRAALGELGSLLPPAMIAVLIANDHVLKFVFHNAITGKLSDIAICFVMPLLVSAALGLIAGGSVRWRLWIGAAVTAVVFSALEMSDLAGRWFVGAVAILFGAKHTVLTRDPTDLLALLMVPVAVAYGRRCARVVTADNPWRRLRGALALATGSLALMATSAPERCGQWTAPTVFKVEGDCGTGGLIVIEASSFSGSLSIANRTALLPPPASGLGVNQEYNGTACPYTLDQGNWEITYGYCSTPAFPDPLPLADAGTDASDAGAGAARDGGSPSPSSCPNGYRQCQAALESDGLWFTCRSDPATVICRSKLTVQP